MCGIAGLISATPWADAARPIESALRRLAHRGPDGSGLFVQERGARDASLVVNDRARPMDAAPGGGEALGIALGHRRLAIVDPSDAAGQPMASRDGRFVLAFNGEIYNHLELRRELESHGEQFHTRSDTEVLLSALTRWDRDGVFDRLVGMYAFALLDRHERTLLLARDEFGIKPLYYAEGPQLFAFASEPHAVAVLTSRPLDADPRGVADYLIDGITDHRESTLFAGIRAVAPASWMRVSLSDARVLQSRRYWTLPDRPLDDRPAGEAARDLRERFVRSVQLQMRSDVALGTLLSGGIDSSSIVMAMREVGGASLDLHTFSYVPDGGAISEEPWIDTVNRAARAVPHKVTLDREEWERHAGIVARHQGEPFGTVAVDAQAALYGHAAREGVRVLLDGQGGDELFAGYGLFRGLRLAGHVKRAEFRRVLQVTRALGPRTLLSSAQRSAVMDAVRTLVPEQFADQIRRRETLADPQWLSSNQVVRRQGWRAASAYPVRERLRDGILAGSLPGLLRYADRGSMMHSTESRVPFLTRDLAEFALSQPEDRLVSDSGVGKMIFRSAMRGLVPDAVLDRSDKIGFSVPLGGWLARSSRLRARVVEGMTLPCINHGFAERLLAELDIEGPRRPRTVFLLWRLAGLAEWVDSCDVAMFAR